MKRNCLSLMIGALLATGPVLAQESPTAGRSASPTNLDSIKVTARKREETLQEVPVAVTAFTSEALDRMNVQDISDLDAQVPNLTIYAARGASSTVTAYIRGIGQSDPTWGADPGVGIYLDDVYIARPQGALLDVFDVSRIEVLRARRARSTARTPSAARSSTSRAACPPRPRASPRSPWATTASWMRRRPSAARLAAPTVACAPVWRWPA